MRVPWKSFGRAGLVFGGLLLGLAVAELGVRTLAPQVVVTEQLQWASHGDVGFRLEPGTFVKGKGGGPINELGLRGPPVGAKAPGERRIAVLGDSFVYGAGVEIDETLCAVIEGLARESDPAAPVRVVNAGTPSYGTDREARWLEAFGDQLAPDVLLLCVFVGNDITDNMPGGPVVFDGKLVYRTHLTKDWKLWLRLFVSQSHLWRLAMKSRNSVKATAAPPPPPPPKPQRSEEELKELRRRQMEYLANNFAQVQRDRVHIYLPDAKLPPHLRQAYASTERSLERIRAWCERRGIPFAIALLPDVMQVEDDARERVCRVGGTSPDDYVWDRPQRAIEAWCERAGVPCVDLLPEFRARGAEGGEKSLYLFFDSHFNVAGHRLAGEIVWQELAGVLLP